ncbi:MAG: trypsin-like peptidase domain-containing protein [Bacillaceae bacterium]|nr:trypsin-like peptidase domain-containing protein [Bacillaceae bacterium]
MGYYDDHARKPDDQERKGWVMPTIVGIILGAVLVLLALPALVESNLLPYDLTKKQPENHLAQGDQNEDREATEVINVDISTQVTEVVQNVQDTVVGVNNIRSSNFWIQQPTQAGTGSGVVYKKEDGKAYIVTNHHVIAGADRVEVVLADGTKVDAELIGSDDYTDLAVLSIDGNYINHVIEMGSSENVKVGEPVLAIGNPLGLQFAGSVTQGIISGVDRVVPQDIDRDGRAEWHLEVLQTDAAINPGNSGGALVNIRGQLIGINSMKIAQSAVEGIGFSIPIDTAKEVIKDLEEDGTVTRPYMGVSLGSLSQVPKYHWTYSLKLPESVEGGVILDQVAPASPASAAGLQRFDVIVQMDDQEILDIADLLNYLYKEKEPGEEVTITYYREGERYQTQMTLSAQQYSPQNRR